MAARNRRVAARIALAMTMGTLLLASMARAQAPAWNPVAWSSEDTLELRTQAPGEDPHWSPVWLVVVDGQLYVRLGGRATGRFEESVSKPIVGVRIAGQQFETVRGVPAPEKAEAVSRAMADKYWSDVFIRLVSHPLVLRLVPE